MEERPPIRRLAAHILNKQSRTVDKEWFSSLGVGRGANNSSPLKFILLRNIHRQSLGPGLIFWYDKQRKRDMRFGTWNVRSLYRAGSLMAAVTELARYKLDLVGVQEARWDKGGTERAGDLVGVQEARWDKGGTERVRDFIFFLWKRKRKSSGNRIFAT